MTKIEKSIIGIFLAACILMVSCLYSCHKSMQKALPELKKHGIKGELMKAWEGEE